MRSLKDYILLFMKGLAMGAADVVPGVSGGTIAFITGIYDELLASISSVNFSLIKIFKEQGFKGVWKAINGNFLVVLLSGIAVSIFSLAQVITYLLHHQPILLWSFFFGLIVASIWYVGKQITTWNATAIFNLLAGTVLVIWLSITPPLDPNASYLFLFFAGAIASCAMILPGISGSFILLLLGAYSTVMTGVSDRDYILIGVLVLGAVVGLLTFSKLLNYLLKNYRSSLIAVLTGFLIGSLWKIWPWKEDPLVYVKRVGKTPLSDITNDYHSLSAFKKTLNPFQLEQYKPYVEVNITPFQYETLNTATSANLAGAILCALAGFGLLFLIEFLAVKKNA